MTPEELDEAQAREAYRQWQEEGGQWTDSIAVAARAARLARENWTPPEPVAPDILAFREWFHERLAKWDPASKEATLKGRLDNSEQARAYLAGARMATERERERARLLVEYVQDRRYEDAQADRIHARYTGRRCDD